MARVYRPGAVLKEHQVEATCTAFLKLDGWRALKTDPVRNREWGKGFGELGMSDFLYVRYRGKPCGEHATAIALRLICGPQHVELMWIEWKRIDRKGIATKAKQHQRDWHAAERALGALTLIAGEDFVPTIEGFQEYYFASGLNRRLIDQRRTA